jgi:hypothetical protein
MTNAAVFLVGVMAIGGAAIDGKVEAGRFFVGNKGPMTEVSKSVYAHSQIHERSVFISVPALFILSAWYARRKPK